MMTKPLLAILLLIAHIAGCATQEGTRYHGSTFFKRLPPCQVDPSGRGYLPGIPCEGTETVFIMDHLLLSHTEFDDKGIGQGLEYYWLIGVNPPSLWCLHEGRRVEEYEASLWKDPNALHTLKESCPSAQQAQTTSIVRASGGTNASTPEQRLDACDSFGFERGTEAHAECAMKLYMNEQNQGVGNAVTSSNSQQTAALARQQAVQEATLKEQKRIRELEAALRGVQIGIGIMNGTTSSSSSAPKTQTQTYTINGQIINCTTTGSVTNCF